MTAQAIFDAYARTPAARPGWTLEDRRPGPEHLLDSPVYTRGAMTLHALRKRIGDAAFFRLLRRWAESSTRSATCRSAQFIALAERISGKQLDAFFRTWLFTPRKPAGIGRSAHFEQGLADRRARLDRGVGVGGAFEREALADDRLACPPRSARSRCRRAAPPVSGRAGRA